MPLLPIRTRRLELVPLSHAFLDALLAGRRDEAQALASFPVPAYWPGEHEGHFRMRLDQMQRDPATGPWLVRALVLRDDGREAVGRAGFHGPTGVNGQHDPAAVEIGYDVDPEHRRNGYASEAVLGLIEWAAAEHGIRRFLASISPANAPSLGVARKLGFVQVGTQWDEEDGEELVFELRR